VNVWYDEFELRIGDSLRRKIDQGLSRSRFGLVVVSHAFFAKNWPQYELDGLVALEMAGRQRILSPNSRP
jgi:TIR domain-containing protein